MEKLFCGYCGEILANGCDCEREAAEAHEQWQEDYYNSPETQAGWVNEDLIYNSRRER